MRRAGAVTVGDGRQTLNMSPEQLPECLLLCLAQFRKLFCHMGNRAMVLADLHAVADRPGRRCEPHRVEGFGDCVRCRLDVVDICRISRFDVSDDRLNPTLGELLDCRVSADFTELPHRGSRQIVVGVAEAAAAGRGDLELLGGTTSSTLTQRRRRSSSGFAGLDQRIQVTSDTCGTQTEARADFGGGNGAFFE